MRMRIVKSANVSWYDLESFFSLSQPNLRHSRNHQVDLTSPTLTSSLGWGGSSPGKLSCKILAAKDWRRCFGCFPFLFPFSTWQFLRFLTWENRNEKLAGNRHLLTRFGAGEASFRVNNNRFLVHMRIVLDCPISRGLILYMHWLIVDTLHINYQKWNHVQFICRKQDAQTKLPKMYVYIYIYMIIWVLI